MIGRGKIAALGCAALVVLVGCGGKEGGGAYKPQPIKKIEPAKVAAGQEKTLMPIAVGNQWVYSTTIATQGGTEEYDLTFKVISVTPEADGSRFTLSITSSRSGAANQTQVWRTNSKGIFVLSQTNIQPDGKTSTANYNPPQPVVTFPVQEGREVRWSGAGPLPIGGAGQSKFDAVQMTQEFDSDSGRMSGIAVEGKQTWSMKADGGQPVQGLMESTVWFVPGVGIGRLRQDIALGQMGVVTLLRLKTHTVKAN